jgi:hypothetical protein
MPRNTLVGVAYFKAAGPKNGSFSTGNSTYPRRPKPTRPHEALCLKFRIFCHMHSLKSTQELQSSLRQYVNTTSEHFDDKWQRRNRGAAAKQNLNDDSGLVMLLLFQWMAMLKPFWKPRKTT